MSSEVIFRVEPEPRGKEARIEAAIRKLVAEAAIRRQTKAGRKPPKVTSEIKKIDPEDTAFLIPAAVQSLLVNGGDGQRSRRRPSTRAMFAELDKVANSAQALLDALNALHPESASYFRDIFQIARQVRIINIIASHSSSALKEGNKSPFSKLPSARKGFRPSESLAYSAALIFAAVTGEEPGFTTTERLDSSSPHKGVSGAFYDFLEEIFRIRGMRSSPENCGKVALAALKSDHGVKPPRKAPKIP